MTTDSLLCKAATGHLGRSPETGHLVYRKNSCPATNSNHVTVTWNGEITLVASDNSYTRHFYHDLSGTCELDTKLMYCGWFRYGTSSGRVYPDIACANYTPAGLPKYWAVDFYVSVVGFYGVVTCRGSDYYYGLKPTITWRNVSNGYNYTYFHSLTNVSVSTAFIP
jgi:hypothetical protein